MPRPPAVTRPLAALLSSLALAALVLSAATRAGVGAAGPPAAAARFPDSVLAFVDGSRQVTVRGFRRAWTLSQDPRRPDSLTPEAARGFLALLIEKEAMGAKAMTAGLAWSPLDSSRFRAFRDQVMMKSVLDSALFETARRRARAGEPALNRMDLGVAARETAIAGLDVRVDATLCARLALAWKALPVPVSDSSMTAQLRMRSAMPEVAAADTARAVAHSNIGDLAASELLAQWRWLDPWSRPRVETPEAVQGLAHNALFERLLRQRAADHAVDQRPEVRELLARQREYLAVSQLVTHEVYGPIHPDALAMQRWYRGHLADYQVPASVRVGHWTLGDRAGAGKLAATLHDDAAAESLLAQGRRKGANFSEDVTARSDSALFAEAMRLGSGAVIGPDSVLGGWRVAKVLALAPARIRDFDEARPLVERGIIDSVGEVRMRAYVAKVRRETPVRVNPRALPIVMATR